MSDGDWPIPGILFIHILIILFQSVGGLLGGLHDWSKTFQHSIAAYTQYYHLLQE